MGNCCCTGSHSGQLRLLTCGSTGDTQFILVVQKQPYNINKYIDGIDYVPESLFVAGMVFFLDFGS